MVRTKCIRHPADAPMVVIHQWQSDLFCGDKTKAVLLSVFEYWHGVKLSLADSREGEDLYQWHNQSELQNYLMGIAKVRSIGDAVKDIEKDGCIRVRRSTGINQVNKYLFLAKPVQQWVDYWDEVYQAHRESEFSKYPICIPPNLYRATNTQKCSTDTQKCSANPQEGSAITQKEIHKENTFSKISSETTTQEDVVSLRSSDRDRTPSQDQQLGSQEGIEPGDPEGSEDPGQGSAKSKSLRVRSKVTKENPYGLEDPQGFENFWAWYGQRMCPPGNSAIGSKADAAKEWGYLEGNDFLNQGREGFRRGCAIALSEVIAKGSKVKHARGFLRGDRTGGKQSPPMWLEKITVVDTGDANAFLSGVEESSPVVSSQSLDKSIRTELERLNMYGSLPAEWKLKTGKSRPSELTDQEKAEYLSYLRSLQSKTDAA